MPRLLAIGDVHGDIDQLQVVLDRHGLIYPNGRWKGGNSTLVFIGDLTDRGPMGVEVISYVKRLEEEAVDSNGSIVSLLGNHDALILAVALGKQKNGRADRKTENLFFYNGGQMSDITSLLERPELIEWLQDRPAMFKSGTTLFQHCDSVRSYQWPDITTVDQVNSFYKEKLTTEEGAFFTFAVLTDNRYWDADHWGNTAHAKAKLAEYLKDHGCTTVIHGHTRFKGNEAQVYMDGMAVNIDGSMSCGYRKQVERGFVYEVLNG